MIFLFVALLCLQVICVAQSVNETQLTKKQFDDFAIIALDHLNTFTNAVQVLSQGRLGRASLDAHIKDTERYFKKDATIQTNTPTRQKAHTWGIDEYLRDIVLSYHIRFELVDIKFHTVVFNGKSAQPIRDRNNTIIGYEMSGSFIQRFAAKTRKTNKESLVLKTEDFTISEETPKKFKVEIVKEVSPTQGSYWVVKLGDISAGYSQIY